MIKELIQYIRSVGLFSKRKLWVAVAFSVLSSAIVLPVGFLIQSIFDEALPTFDFNLLLKLGATAIGLLIVNGWLSVSARKMILQVTKELIYKIRSGLLNRLLNASHPYYVQADISRIHKIAVYDTEKIDTLFNSFFSIVIPSAIVSVVLIVVLFFLNWPMSLVLFALGLISFWIIDYLRKKGKESLSRFQSMFEVFHRQTLFVLEFYKLIKVTSHQSAELTKQKNIVKNLNAANLEMIDGFTKMNYYQDLIFSVSSIILLVFGGYLVIHHSMTLGTLLSFYFCLYLLRRYLNSINAGIPIIIEGTYSLLQYQNLIADIREESYLGTTRIDFKGNIHVNSISFSFPSKKIFEKFSLHLQAGKVTLLSGPNGSGKSTLIHLLLGFYKPDHGSLVTEGIFYEDIDMSYFRTHISVLFQETYIFNGTISENILYARAGAHEREIEKALESASLKEFIHSLPEGLQTAVGEKGMKLSGGQRQKLALARCFLSKPPLIIMDEPTNHLDRETITHFIKALRNIDHQPALLLVSHNSDLSELADTICIMQTL